MNTKSSIEGITNKRHKAVPKEILSQRYKNLISRKSKKKSLDIKKSRTTKLSFHNSTSENIPRNTSLYLQKEQIKREGGSRKAKEFTGVPLSNSNLNQTSTINILGGGRRRSSDHFLNFYEEDTSEEKVNFCENNDELSKNISRKRKLRSHSNRSLDIFLKKTKNSTVEKIMKNLKKKNKINLRGENPRSSIIKPLNQNYVDPKGKKVLGGDTRKSYSLSKKDDIVRKRASLRRKDEDQGQENNDNGNKNKTFNDIFLKENLLHDKGNKNPLEISQIKSASMCNLYKNNIENPSPVIDSKSSMADSKRTPLDNYFKIYLSQCKSIKFTSPETEVDCKREHSTAHEHNAQNSEFIENLKKYLSTDRLSNEELKKLSEIDGFPQLEILSKNEDKISESGESDVPLKTKRKYNEIEKVENEDESNNKRFEFSSKVLGNLDQRSRQKFFKKKEGYKYVKNWRNSIKGITKTMETGKFGKTEENIGLKENRVLNEIRRLEKSKSRSKDKRTRSGHFGDLEEGKRNNSLSRKRRHFEIFKEKISKECTYERITQSRLNRGRRNSSTGLNKSRNSRGSHRSFSQKSNTKIKNIEKFDSSVMSKEIKELTDELKKLRFTKEKITEFNDIFLPYLDFTFNLEIENKNLKESLEDTKKYAFILDEKIKDLEEEKINGISQLKKEYELKLKEEIKEKDSFKKKLEEATISISELKKQNEILNDVLKGFCQERDEEEKISFETNHESMKSFREKNYENNNNSQKSDNRRRGSVRRSQNSLIGISPENYRRNSPSIPNQESPKNPDEVLELKYQLKLANEEISDFKVKIKNFNNFLEFA